MDQLYQDRILIYARAIRMADSIAAPSHQASVSNPTCGDRADVTLLIENEVIAGASAKVRGCALCEAGAGLFINLAPQRPQQDLAHMRDSLTAWLAGDDSADIDEEMNTFAPVRPIKNRHKCVTLAFEAAVKAAADQGPSIGTD